MSKAQQNTDLTAICKHISRVMGSDKRTRLVIHEIQNWCSNSGPEWTLERLKTLKRGSIRFISDEVHKSSGIFPMPKDAYIKHDSLGWPKGPLGNLIKATLLNKKSPIKAISKLFSVLEVGRVFKHREVSERQLKKFKESITGDPFREDLFSYSKKLGHQCEGAFPKLLKSRFKYYYKSTHRFTFAGLNTAKPFTTFVDKKIEKEEHKWLLSLIEGTIVDAPWTKILKSFGVPILDQKPKALYAGRISVLQEGGLKARVIAVPTAGVQVAFKPLHDALGKLLRQLPEDCTYNQESGVEWGAKEIREGKLVHAVDLSSATDNFPIGFQRAVLESLEYPYTEEFLQTCQMQWGFKGDRLNGPLRYSKGQPMGLYGSFALFALSHHYVLKKLEQQFKVSNTYRILGDDIIISNDDVHKEYMKFMSYLGVPISISKCLDSDLYTEFAGKIISADGRVPVAKGPKTSNKKGLMNVNQFRNYCEVSGTTKYAITGVPKRYRRYAECLMSLPKNFGGLGINPKGLPLEERLTTFEESKRRIYPLQADLSSSVKRLPFKASHDHVGLVCEFVNEQLTGIHSYIASELKKRGFIFDGNPQVQRAMLAQVLDAEGGDDTASFKATISEGIKREANVFDDWKNSYFSINSKIEEVFDATIGSDTEEVSSKLNQDPSFPSPWI